MNEVVAATAFRNCVLVFTRHGKVYRIEIDELTGRLRVSVELTIPLDG